MAPLSLISTAEKANDKVLAMYSLRCEKPLECEKMLECELRGGIA